LPKRRESNPTGSNNWLVGGEKWSLSKTGVAVEKLAPRKVSEKLCVRKPYPAAPGSETAPFQNPIPKRHVQALDSSASCSRNLDLPKRFLF